ncbi:MAG: deoxynucleoside kinase [Deltaproteobacteria bacterium]|nr:deoxynucleoside kinase [Deltaproteobacteria bacterium]
MPHEPRYIAVEGPIGVGKSSLARKLAETFKARLILEEAYENPFLPEFYKDRARNALKTQIYFLLSRYQQQKELAQQDLFNQITVCDYLFSKDRIFATVNLSRDEQLLYEKIYRLLDGSLPRPDLVVYLQSEVGVLIKNIKKRAIPFEKSIDTPYLEELAEAYNQYFFSYTETPLLVVNCTKIDFVKNEVDYQNLVKEILSTKRGQKNFVALGGSR